MEIKINIPKIEPVKVPTIPNFSNIKVDTSAINATVETAAESAKNIKRASLFAQLAPFKAKTIPIMGKACTLSEDDRITATKIVSQLIENNWLDAENEKWCIANGITI